MTQFQTFELTDWIKAAQSLEKCSEMPASRGKHVETTFIPHRHSLVFTFLCVPLPSAHTSTSLIIYLVLVPELRKVFFVQLTGNGKFASEHKCDSNNIIELIFG